MDQINDEEKAFIAFWLLNEKTNPLKLIMKPLENYEVLLESLGWEREDDEEPINGWQVDFWYYYTKGDQRICLAGSLWYGNWTLNNSPKEEGEDD